MGDMADFALDCAWEQTEHYEKYKESPLSVQYDEGLVDEIGVMISAPFTKLHTAKPTGAGPCPVCGGNTAIKYGIHGDFFGCSNFPECKGSRNK